ncbi:LysR family transcriptional regulator [Rhodococcus sp. NPDC127530]|uniref:LysR family transcriptional regulator n=1 Tax=unclassified Rhodococcus (in: high G+C Gram-positive bacteria) TaxID=192944 RepID=UPI0036456652
MDARQLRYFLSVVDHGGMTRAAEALYIAQPSLSQAIRALERELDVELFHRLGRGLELSAAGRALVGPARQVLGGVLETSDAVRRIQQLEEGRLDVAVTSDLAVEPLADFIRVFRDLHPGVWVNVLRASDSDEAAELVKRATCEIALCSLPVRVASGAQALPLGQHTLALAVPPGHRLCGRDSIPLAGLEEIDLVAGPLGDVVRDLLEEACRAAGVEVRVAVEIGMLPVHPRLVASGAGAAILPPAQAREAVELGAHLCRIDPPMVQAFGFVHRKDSLDAASQAFMMIARRFVAQP